MILNKFPEEGIGKRVLTICREIIGRSCQWYSLGSCVRACSQRSSLAIYISQRNPLGRVCNSHFPEKPTGKGFATEFPEKLTGKGFAIEFPVDSFLGNVRNVQFPEISTGSREKTKFPVGATGMAMRAHWEKH